MPCADVFMLASSGHPYTSQEVSLWMFQNIQFGTNWLFDCIEGLSEYDRAMFLMVL